MENTKWYILYILISACLPLNAQGILEDYIATGLENNHQLIREQIDSQIAQERIAEARGKFLPHVFLDASYSLADGGRTIDVPAGDLVNPAYRGLNELLGENRFPTNITNTSEQFLPNDFHETKIRIIQPIINSDIFYNYQAQIASLSIQKAKEKAYENQLIKEIKVAYFAYLSALSEREILHQSQSLIEEQLRVSKRLVDNQKATKAVIFSSQAALSNLKSRLAGAERRVSTSKISFNFLLSRELNAPIMVDIAFVISTIIQEQSVDELSQSALSNRQEITQLQRSLDATKITTKLNKGHWIPDVNVVSDVGYQGFGYQFNEPQDFWFVRFGLTWNIFEGLQNRKRVNQSILREQQLETELDDLKSRITLEVTQAYLELKEAIYTLEARQSELKNTSENFRIIARKYGENQVLLVEYTNARNELITAELASSIARYNVKIKEATLDAAVNSIEIQ